MYGRFCVRMATEGNRTQDRYIAIWRLNGLNNQDLTNPHATLAIMWDFSKAFNRQEHNLLIIILSDMGTPGWLLKLVMAFLEERRMVLQHKGCTSEEERLPGGGPAGTKLG